MNPYDISIPWYVQCERCAVNRRNHEQQQDCAVFIPNERQVMQSFEARRMAAQGIFIAIPAQDPETL